MISYTHHFLFIHVYKVAGTSIREALTPFADDPSRMLANRIADRLHVAPKWPFPRWRRFRDHVTAAEVKAELPPAVWSGLYKFAFVRNPWDWQVSLYEYIRNTRQHYSHDPVVRLTFDEYLRWRLTNDFRLQRSFVCDANGYPLLDFIGRYERLEADFASVMALLGITLSLRRANETERGDYREYYTPETRSLVADAFAPDIDLFKFEFDDGVQRST